MNKINQMIKKRNEKIAEMKERMISQGFRPEFIENFVPKPMELMA